jgi:hypothetical protein
MSVVLYLNKYCVRKGSDSMVMRHIKSFEKEGKNA